MAEPCAMQIVDAYNRNIISSRDNALAPKKQPDTSAFLPIQNERLRSILLFNQRKNRETLFYLSNAE
jgi:hypothetical protein